MENPWKTKTSKTVYETPWMKVVEDSVTRPDGTDGTYSFIETANPSVYIVPVTESGEIYLIAQWRYPTKTHSWELPGGGGDSADVLESAKKELKEETGLEAESWSQIGKLQPMDGITSEIEHVFVAENLKQTGQHEQRVEGITEVKTVAFSEVLEMIKTGEITDAQTIAALMQFGIYAGKIKG